MVCGVWSLRRGGVEGKRWCLKLSRKPETRAQHMKQQEALGTITGFIRTAHTQQDLGRAADLLSRPVQGSRRRTSFYMFASLNGTGSWQSELASPHSLTFLRSGCPLSCSALSDRLVTTCLSFYSWSAAPIGLAGGPWLLESPGNPRRLRHSLLSHLLPWRRILRDAIKTVAEPDVRLAQNKVLAKHTG